MEDGNAELAPAVPLPEALAGELDPDEEREAFGHCTCLRNYPPNWGEGRSCVATDGSQDICCPDDGSVCCPDNPGRPTLRPPACCPPEFPVCCPNNTALDGQLGACCPAGTTCCPGVRNTGTAFAECC
jgi:hypothetical protein